jgi:hypothetical protein
MSKMKCGSTEQEEHKVIKYAVLEKRTASIFNVTKSGAGGW